MAKRGKSGGRGRAAAGVVENPGPGSKGPVEGVYYVDTGDCELIADQDNSTGWLLKINGVMSSHIDLADPLFLDFEYMRWIAALIESRWPPSDASSTRGGAADNPGKLRGLHLGGGACSLAGTSLLPTRTRGRWWWNLTASSPSTSAAGSTCPRRRCCGSGWGRPGRSPKPSPRTPATSSSGTSSPAL